MPIVIQQSLVFRDSGIDTGFVKGDLLLLQEHRLYVAEYVLMTPIFTRRKYRFHLQDAANRLVLRWDNAPHHPHLSTFPHHCHRQDGEVVASAPMDLPSVLDAITPLLA